MSKKSVVGATITILILLALAQGLRWFVRARTVSASNSCINNLRQIDGAVQQWALEHDAATNTVVTMEDIKHYLGRGVEGEIPKCPHNGPYSISRVCQPPHCSIGGPDHTLP